MYDLKPLRAQKQTNFGGFDEEDTLRNQLLNTTKRAQAANKNSERSFGDERTIATNPTFFVAIVRTLLANYIRPLNGLFRSSLRFDRIRSLCSCA